MGLKTLKMVTKKQLGLKVSVDTESVKKLTSDFREDEYRMKDLIVSIVLSETFKTR